MVKKTPQRRKSVKKSRRPRITNTRQKSVKRRLKSNTRKSKKSNKGGRRKSMKRSRKSSSNSGKSRKSIRNSGVEDILNIITYRRPEDDIDDEDEIRDKYEFVTHDNGYFPFGVNITGGKASIYDTITDKLLYTFGITRFWYGRGHGDNERLNDPFSMGNSVLLELANYANKYVYICESILEFTTPEPIVDFYATLGNSDVVYAYARSRNYTYIFQVTRDYDEPDQNSIDYINNSLFFDAGGGAKGPQSVYDVYYGGGFGKYLNGRFDRIQINTLIGRHQLKK